MKTLPTTRHAKPQHAGAAPKQSQRVYGLAAAIAAFEAQPQSVVSIAYTTAARQPLAALLRAAAKRRIAYREVAPEELTRMAQSVHHEGVCLLVKQGPTPTAAALLQGVGSRGLLLALDGVENPHNIGAILRSAAYFGARGLLYTSTSAADAAGSTTLSPAARRVAEGGAEHVPVAQVSELASTLRDAKRAGLAVLGCDARADVCLTQFTWPQRALLVLGHERHGLSRATRAVCDLQLRIPGSAHVDSLNVSVAAGIFLASYAQLHGASA